MTLTELVSKAETLIHNVARKYGNEKLGTGDGSSTVFYAIYPPIKTDSETVYVDGVAQTQTTHYTIENGLGRITFVAAPSANSDIRIDYTGLHIETADLETLATDAVEDLILVYPTTAFSISGSDVSPTPTQAQERLLVRQVCISALESEQINAARVGMRSARTGMSIDTTSRARELNRIVEILTAKLHSLSTRLLIRGIYTSEEEHIKR